MERTLVRHSFPYRGVSHRQGIIWSWSNEIQFHVMTAKLRIDPVFMLIETVCREHHTCCVGELLISDNYEHNQDVSVATRELDTWYLVVSACTGNRAAR